MVGRRCRAGDRQCEVTGFYAHAGMVTERSYPSTITGYVPGLVGPKKNGLAPATSTTLPSNVMLSATSPSSVLPCVNVKVTLPTPGSPARQTVLNVTPGHGNPTRSEERRV